MLRPRRHRLLYILMIIFSAACAFGLALYALNQNINLFFTPDQVVAGQAPKNHLFRMGGKVEAGSVKYGKNLTVTFVLSNKNATVPVYYNGILPTLFREKQEIIVDGKLNAQGVFIATQVLAKHDETYAPRTR